MTQSTTACGEDRGRPKTTQALLGLAKRNHLPVPGDPLCGQGFEVREKA